MIVRWGIGELPALAGERPLVVASPRWRDVLDAADRWEEVPPSHRIDVSAGVDTIVAIGGGSAIDGQSGVGGERRLPLVSVPTTYSGAEWTSFFGVRDPDRLMRGGGAGAHLHAIVYEPDLTWSCRSRRRSGRPERARTLRRGALRPERTPESDRDALAGAELIGTWLPLVVERPGDPEARERLLRGACHAGAALGGSMLALGHALAQALGGRYGAPHGALNALTLPPALRFSRSVAGEAIARFGTTLRTADPAGRVETWRGSAASSASATSASPRTRRRRWRRRSPTARARKANPREVTPADAEALIRSIW